MLTRRGLFSALVGAVAAVFGAKAASKLALHPQAFSRTMAPLVTGSRHVILPGQVGVMEFRDPIVDMTVIQGDVYVTTEREVWHLVKDGPPERLAHWGM